MRLLLGIALCVTFQLVLNASAISAEFEVVKIGAIFFHNEIDLIEAFETAIEDINQLELNVRLQPIKHYLSADDSIVLQKLTCHLIESNVAAIFGPSSKASSAYSYRVFTLERVFTKVQHSMFFKSQAITY